MRLTPLLSALILVPACAIAQSRIESKPEVLVSLKEPSNQGLAQVCRAYGKAAGKDFFSQLCLVELRPGLSEQAAAKALSRNPLVRFALPGSARYVNTTSYVSVNEHLRYLDDAETLASHGSDSKSSRGAEGKREESRNDFYEALRYYLRSRVNRVGYVDFGAIKNGYAHRAHMPLGQIGARSSSGGFSPMITAGGWSFIGPKNLTDPYNVYFGTPPLSGRVSAIAYDPTTSSTIYVGSGGGGIWKSTNSGVTWTCLSDNSAWQYEAVDAIAVDPKNNQVIYVGTGDFDGFFAGYNQGVMKSTDGGMTWTNVTPNIAGISDLSVSRVTVDPDNDQIVTITTGRGSYGGPNASTGGIWRSTNAGGSWAKASGPVASDYCALDISLASGGTRTYWAAGAGSPALLYKSTNQGATWTQVTTLPDTNPEFDWTLACSKVSASTLYVLLTYSDKVYKSTNSGASWTSITTATFPEGITGQSTYNWSQSSYDYFLGTAASSQASAGEILFCGLITMAYSTDGGTTWTDYGDTYDGSNESGTALMHNDQHQFAMSPSDSSQVLVGNDGGLTRINLTWTSGVPNFSINQLNAGLGITQLYGIAPHPTDSTQILGGAQDNASPSSLGDLNNWANPGGGDGGASAWDIPESCFLTSSDGGYVEEYSLSGNDLGSLSNGFNAGGFIMPMLVSNDGSKIILGTNDLEIYDFTDPSAGFVDKGVDLTGGNYNYIQSLATAPGDENRIYTGATSGEVFMTTNLGTSYKEIDEGALPQAVVGAVEANPTNENDVLVGFQSLGDGIVHLWRCTNVSAATPAWANVSGSGATGLPDVPVNAIVFDPYTPSTTWYVGTDVGVMMTTNAGSTWSNVSTGMPVTQVFDLRYASGYLYAGTFGRGVYRIAVTSSGDGGGGGGGTESGSPWPKFRANVSNTGQPAVGGSPAGAVKWSVNIGKGTASYSSAAIDSGGILYVGADNGEIYALNSTTGTTKWALLLNGEVLSSPLIGSDGTIYVGTTAGSFFALSSTNGAVKWSVSLHNSISSSATIDSGGTIYVGIGNDLEALNSSNGSVKWSFATSGAVQSSPALGSDGTLYVGSMDKHLYAINSSNGSLKWSRATGPVTGSPTLSSSGNVFIADTSGDIYALNSSTGAISWATVEGPVSSSPGLGPDGTVYIASTNGRVYAFNPSTGALKRTVILGGAIDSSPAIGLDGTLYVGCEDKHLYSISPSTGVINWALAVGGAVETSPSIDANGVVYAGSDDGYYFSTNGSVAVSRVAASPNRIVGGASSTGSVTVTGASPGATVALASSSSSLTVPASVTATAYGTNTLSFTIKSLAVTTFVNATVTATFGASTAAAAVVISPNAVFSDFYTLPANVTGGSNATGVVQIYSPAPSGGMVVSLKSGTSYMVVPASVTIPAGSTGVSFTITSSPVAAPSSVTLVATSGSNSVHISVPIEPYPVLSFAVSPNTVVGGTTTYATLTIGGKAVSPGETITLSSNSSSVSVPASVKVASGTNTVTFPVTTSKVTADLTVTLTATAGTNSTTTTVNLQP